MEINQLKEKQKELFEQHKKTKNKTIFNKNKRLTEKIYELEHGHKPGE